MAKKKAKRPVRKARVEDEVQIAARISKSVTGEDKAKAPRKPKPR